MRFLKNWWSLVCISPQGCLNEKKPWICQPCKLSLSLNMFSFLTTCSLYPVLESIFRWQYKASLTNGIVDKKPNSTLFQESTYFAITTALFVSSGSYFKNKFPRVFPSRWSFLEISRTWKIHHHLLSKWSQIAFSSKISNFGIHRKKI